MLLYTFTSSLATLEVEYTVLNPFTITTLLTTLEVEYAVLNHFHYPYSLDKVEYSVLNPATSTLTTLEVKHTF
jgi:hypothetical protein